jgi:Tfp pilus assembly protein PilF
LAALKTDPSSPEAHNTLGGIYLRQGKSQSAPNQFEEAIRLNPDFAAAHFNWD